MDTDFALQKNMISAYMKIFVNYTQTITIINYLNLNWKNFVPEMFPALSVSSGNLKEVISIECLMPGIFYFIIIIMLVIP